MAVEVFEMRSARGVGSGRAVPFLVKQSLTIGGAASAAFNRSTAMVTIYTDVACRIAFSPPAGATPTASDISFPIPAAVHMDFSIVAGRQVIAF